MWGDLPGRIVAMAIEGSRLVARIERWRAFIGEPGRLPAHPYRPLRGGILDILRAEFADENRWRDVLYVAINLPLSIIEFVVAATVWTLALSLLRDPARLAQLKTNAQRLGRPRAAFDVAERSIRLLK